jgi:hypothetical protein
MANRKDFEPDFTTPATFLLAQTALAEGETVIRLNFEMADFDPPLTTMGLSCSLDNIRKLVHTCLAALDSVGDQPASVLLKMLNKGAKP